MKFLFICILPILLFSETKKDINFRNLNNEADQILLERHILKNDYEKLDENYKTQFKNIEKIEKELKEISDKYNTLLVIYNKMNGEYQALQNNQNLLFSSQKDFYESTTRNVKDFYEHFTWLLSVLSAFILTLITFFGFRFVQKMIHKLVAQETEKEIKNLKEITTNLQQQHESYMSKKAEECIQSLTDTYSGFSIQNDDSQNDDSQNDDSQNDVKKSLIINNMNVKQNLKRSNIIKNKYRKFQTNPLSINKLPMPIEINKEIKQSSSKATNKRTAYDWFMLSIKAFNINDFSSSLEYIQKAIELNEDNPKAYSLLSVIYNRMDDYIRAKQSIEKAIELDQSNVLYYAYLFQYSMHLHDFESSKKAIEKAIELNTKDSTLYFLYSTLYGALQDWDNAQKVIEKAIELDPNKARNYSQLASVFKNKKDWDNAQKAIEKAIELDSKNARNYSQLASVFKNKKNWDNARKAIEKAIELDPKNAEYFYLLFSLFEEEKDWDNAQKAIEKAIELDNKNSLFYATLSGVFQEQNQMSKAKDFINKAIELSQESYYYVILATYYTIEKDWDNAEKFYELAIDKDSNNASAYYNFATMKCLKQESKDIVFDTLLKAFNLDSKYKKYAREDEDLKEYFDDLTFINLTSPSD